MKDQNVFDFDALAPMLATEGSVANLKAGQWAFEGKWDGYRLLVEADHGACGCGRAADATSPRNFPN